METKADLINDAYDEGRISGLTVNPKPEEIKKALRKLERMAAEWNKRNICVGYNFEATPDVNSPHNIPIEHQTAFSSNLMVRLLSRFGKDGQDPKVRELRSLATDSFANLVADTAPQPLMGYPSKMPIGSGHRRYGYYRKFYGTVETAPIECATAKMVVGDLDNFYEDFAAYLNSGETVASAVITADTGLTITNEAVSSPRVTYTVTATGATDDFKTLYQVVVVMTTSAGRIETRLRNFELTEIEID